MRFNRQLLLAVAAAIVSPVVGAVDNTMTAAGFTGLGITPNAHLLRWGRFEGSYERQLPGVITNPAGHNFVAGFGLLPNLEISGRIAANTIQTNCFTQNCGARDLSASGKVGIGLDARRRFHVAAGINDFGGNVTYFRSLYGVLTYDEGPLQASAGLARRSGAGVGGSKSPLHGPFAGAAWQPLTWARAHVEYSDKNAWAGVKLFAPAAWVPEGWTAHVGANLQLTRNNLTQRSWLTAGVSIPLYKVPELLSSAPKAPLPPLASGQLPEPSYEARRLGTPQAASPTQGTPSPNVALQDAELHLLAEALRVKGLEDISIGRMPDGSIAVLANNASYNWNIADALGVALGTIARTVGTAKAGYRLVLTQRQVPVVAVTGQANCLKEWIANAGASCTAGELSTPGTGALEPLHDGAVWVVRKLQPSWQTLRVAISPVLRTNIATEVGVLDYSLSANVGLLLPLWNGASIEWRQNLPLANSSDYERTGAFGNRRIQAATERVALTQTMRIPVEQWFASQANPGRLRWGLGGLSAQGSVGRFGTSFDGVHGALRWEPGEGRHRVSGQAGFFRNAEFNEPGTPFPSLRTAKPLLGSYRYRVIPTRTDIEATGGQFMNNDRGVQLGMHQWFSDVSVGVYYKRTKFTGAGSRSFVGLELSLPIGPRKDMNPTAHVQVTGTPRFAHAVETLTGQANVVTSGHGILPPVPTLDAVFNSDRAGLAYFEDNIRRIRDAAR